MHTLSKLVPIALVLVACGGAEAERADPLFATARSDVHPFVGDDGVEAGRVNLSYRIAWEYARGYSGLGEDLEALWGPLEAIPADLLQSIERRELEPSVSSGAVGFASTNTTTPKPIEVPPAPGCVCLYRSKIDGKCTWWRC